MNIRISQIAHFSKLLDDSWVAQAVEEIYVSFVRAFPEQARRYTPGEAAALIAEVIEVATHYEIRDLDDYTRWAHLRLASGKPFYKQADIVEYLEDPLVHPTAKARNVALAAAVDLLQA